MRPRLRHGHPLGPLPGLLVLLTPLSQLGYIPVAVVLGLQLGADLALVGLTIGVYNAAAAVATLVFGPLFDLIPARKVLPWAVAVNVAVSLTLIVVPNVAVLMAGRILTGVSTSVLMLCASILVADAHSDDPRARDRGFSNLQTFNSFGAASGLAIGALAAGLSLPWLYFSVVALYGMGILCITPALMRRMPDHSPLRSIVVTGSFGMRLRALVREAALTARSPSTLCLLLGAAGVGWIIQGGHYGVSLILADLDPSLVQRIGLAVLIPFGVFIGSSLNQLSLGRFTATELLARVYWLLPLACIAYAASVSSQLLVAQVPALVVLGVLTGMLMPLSPAVIVSWYPGIRGSAAAAESIAKAMGATLSPVLLGMLAAEWNLATALVGVAAVALVGAVATLGFVRRAAIA
ncbi:MULTISPECIES: MFS transporter [unclassified Salinibacterium]|uniref:MFS transporter n=1 Tax=unclassified Salinibacterium TaxID=2632331 RepID=UPI00143CDED4|nr:MULTISPECIES: MFS transporter [unclassified Salinibacterium]